MGKRTYSKPTGTTLTEAEGVTKMIQGIKNSETRRTIKGFVVFWKNGKLFSQKGNNPTSEWTSVESFVDYILS